MAADKFASVKIEDGIAYINHDLAPTTLKDRKWAMKDIAALWISMSACVPTYMLASSLIAKSSR